jgi:hypothetical protein
MAMFDPKVSGVNEPDCDAVIMKRAAAGMDCWCCRMNRPVAAAPIASPSATPTDVQRMACDRAAGGAVTLVRSEATSSSHCLTSLMSRSRRSTFFSRHRRSIRRMSREVFAGNSSNGGSRVTTAASRSVVVAPRNARAPVSIS